MTTIIKPFLRLYHLTESIIFPRWNPSSSSWNSPTSNTKKLRWTSTSRHVWAVRFQKARSSKAPCSCAIRWDTEALQVPWNLTAIRKPTRKKTRNQQIWNRKRSPRNWVRICWECFWKKSAPTSPSKWKVTNSKLTNAFWHRGVNISRHCWAGIGWRKMEMLFIYR